MGGGPEPFNPKYFGGALNVVRDGGHTADARLSKHYMNARKNGVFDGHYTGEQIEELGRGSEVAAANTLGQVAQSRALRQVRERFVEPGTNAVKAGFKKTRQKVKSIYRAEDAIARFSYYMHAIETRGLQPEEAAKLARKWIPQYDDLSRFSKDWSKFAAPFWGFAAKALPLVAEAAVSNPLRFAAFGVLGAAFAKTQFDEEVPEEVLPAEMRGVAASLPGPRFLKKAVGSALPTFIASSPGPEGSRNYLDATYMMPYGDIAEARGRDEHGPFSWLPGNLNPAKGPLVATLAALAMNKDPLTARELTTASMSGTEKAQRVMDFVYKQAMPSLAPPIPGITGGGWGARKFLDAAQGIPNRSTGDVMPLSTAVQDVFGGFKQRSIDPPVEYRRRLHEIDRERQDLRFRMREIQRDKSLTPQRKAELIAKLRQQMTRIQSSTRDLTSLRSQVPGL